jgi:purine-binding chemotaxis protein CheW
MKSLPLRELQEPLATLTGIRDEFLRGVTGERLALLDMGKILADKRLIVHEEVD